MSLYLLACPLIFFVAFIQYMKSFEHIFIKTYEFFFLVSSKVSRLVEGLLYLPEIFLLEFLQHFYFLGSLFLCFYAKLITVHIISLTWTYIFFSEILKDPDQIRCSDRSWKRRGIPPIAAYSEQWLIFSAYQLKHTWSSSFSFLFSRIHYTFSPWNDYFSNILFRIQTYAFPVPPDGYITDFIKFSLTLFKLGICILFFIFDTLWILHNFFFQVMYKFGSDILKFMHQRVLKLSSPFNLYKAFLINQWRTNKNYLFSHDRI